MYSYYGNHIHTVPNIPDMKSGHIEMCQCSWDAYVVNLNYINQILLAIRVVTNLRITMHNITYQLQKPFHSTHKKSNSRSYLTFYGIKESVTVFTRSCHMLNEMNPVHTLPPYFSMTHFNIILPVFKKVSFLKVSHRNICSICATFPAHVIILDLTIPAISGEWYKCHFTKPHVTSSLLFQICPQHLVLKHPQRMFIPECKSQEAKLYSH